MKLEAEKYDKFDEKPGSQSYVIMKTSCKIAFIYIPIIFQKSVSTLKTGGNFSRKHGNFISPYGKLAFNF